MARALKYLFFTLSLSVLTVNAQINEFDRKGQLRQVEIDRLNAEKQIRELRNGILLIRLKTRLPLIQALQEKGRSTDAELVRLKQFSENKEIIAAFRTWFKFCPTYFFYSNYSDYIREGKIDSVYFLTDSAEVDSAITLPEKPFYIAEFTWLDRDTATFAGGTYLYRGENGLERRTYYEGGGNYGFEALVFKSAQFYQLRRPFPYYSRTLKSLPVFRRSYKRVVQRANDALFYYYNKVY